jgi:hypothetical protein
MPGLAHSGNHRKSAQKTLNPGNTMSAAACSHVRACYPQAGPQFPGASGKVESRCVQGFAGSFESFLLDPRMLAV